MKRVIYLIAGTVFLILGIIGLALPVIPQIPFLILAAFFMSKGSERVHKWVSGLPVYKKFFPEKQEDPSARKETDPQNDDLK